MRRAFTLIELLVVIAIIAILAAILFPVFSQAKVAAQQSRAVAQMRQMAVSVQMYAGDHDDYFVPSTIRDLSGNVASIWTEGLAPYIKNTQIFDIPTANGGYAAGWSTRHHQPIGYSDATGVNLNAPSTPGAAGPGAEGFDSAVNFSQAEDPSVIGLFATTANAPKDNFTTKHRGYVFNPYNGLNSPDGDYRKGLPMISDRDLVTQTGDVNYPTSPSLSPGFLKPILCRFGADGKNDGRSPIVFADCHTKVYSAKQLNTFGTVIWRFR